MLLKKLFKDIKKNKGQFTAIFFIIFLGCLVFSGLNATWYGMQEQSNQYYKETNLADYWVVGSDISKDVKDDIAALDDVKEVERRLTFRVSDSQDEQATVELNYIEDNKISKNILVEGEAFSLNKKGIWLDSAYAKAHKLKVGDTFSFSFASTNSKVKIVGLISNPEYVYSIGSTGQLLPDHKEFGFGFLSYAKYFDSETNRMPFNQLLVKEKGKTKDEKLKTDITKKTENEKIHYIRSREDTTSYNMLQDKIDQFHTLSTIFPTLFFVVAILIILTTMMRMLKNQRIQIGILQALGFKRKTLMKHYLLYGVIISLPASIIGYFLGQIVLPPFIYQTLSMYTLPKWQASQPSYNILIVIISIVTSIIAVYLSCRSILKEKPVDCLKAKNEGKIIIPWFEKLKLWTNFSFQTKWNVMDCYKNKARTITIVISVAGCMALMLTALGLRDSLNDIMDWQYQKVAKYETKLLLKPTSDSSDISKLVSNFDGEAIEEQVVEIKADNKNILKNMTIYEKSSPSMIQLTDQRKQHYQLPEDGLSISYRLAEKENISIGDNVAWRLISDQEWHESKVTGIYRVPINQGVSITRKFLSAEGYDFKPTALLSSKKVEEINDESIQQVISVMSEKNNINKMIESMSKLVSLLIIAAVLLMVVVLYNLGKLSFVEREREINTLKVLGFKNKILRKIFKREMNVLIIIGIILGTPCAYLLLEKILKMMGSSTDMMLIFNGQTLLIAILGTFITSIVINNLLSIQINKAKLVEALKAID